MAQTPAYSADPDEFSDSEPVTVDGRTFYARRERAQEGMPRRRRYSDQFKDPLFKVRDTYRKLKMAEQLGVESDIGELAEKYKRMVVMCAELLNKEFNASLPEIYAHSQLARFGFGAADFGIAEEGREAADASGEETEDALADE